MVSKNPKSLREILFNNVEHWPKIKKAIIKHYPDQKKNISKYAEVFGQLMKLKPQAGKIRIELDFYKSPDEEPYVDVHGITMKNKQKQLWGLDFTPWAEWLCMEIEEETIDKFSEIEILCHCLWEMTFYGFKETKIKKKLKLLTHDVDEVKRAIKKGKIKLNDTAKKPKNK